MMVRVIYIGEIGATNDKMPGIVFTPNMQLDVPSDLAKELVEEGGWIHAGPEPYVEVASLPGVGKSTAEKLKRHGVVSTRELREASPEVLVEIAEEEVGLSITKLQGLQELAEENGDEKEED